MNKILEIVICIIFLFGVKSQQRNITKPGRKLNISAPIPSIELKTNITNNTRFKFINATVENLELIKDLAMKEDPIDYMNIEEIYLKNVVLRDSEKETNKKILVRELIILNTPDDDPDDKTIIVNKAVVVPSISQDNTIKNLKKRLYKKTTDKYNAQLDELSKLLSQIKIPKLKPHKKPQKGKNKKGSIKKIVKKQLKNNSENKKKLEQAKKTLNQIKIPIMKRKKTIKKVEKTMTDFDSQISNVISETLKVIKHKERGENIKDIMKKVNNLRHQMLLLNYDLTHNAKGDSARLKIKNKIQKMAKEMSHLNATMQKINKEAKEDEIKLKNHKEKLRKLLYSRGAKIEDVINVDDMKEEDFLIDEKRRREEEGKRIIEKKVGLKGFRVSKGGERRGNGKK